MTNIPSSLRPGLTAIAAVLALSATPAFAQTADAQPAVQTAPPLTIAPPAPTAAPAATPLTIAPATQSSPVDSTANMSAPVETAPAAPLATRSTPVVHEAPATAQSEPAGPVARSTTTRVASAAKSAATTTAPAPAAPAPVAKQAAAAEPALAPPAVEPTPPVEAVPATQARAGDHQEIGLIAGAGALGLIAIGGGAFALGRRRRRDAQAADDEAYEVAPEVVAEPAYVAPAASVAAPVALAEGAVPEGFDISRYGPHTRAAYGGPTADNPFLSLRRRLKRASFYDQRLREAGEIGEAMPPAIKQQADRSQTIVGKRLSDRLNFRPAARGSRMSFKPATA